MEKNEMNETLYILMRTDMDSMNPGKAMAQASHASNAFLHENPHTNKVISWSEHTKQGFGTCIVLGVDSETKMLDTVNAFQKLGYFANTIHDPTYPLVDGSVVHFIPVNTCAYVFVENRETDGVARVLLSKYSLHP